MRGGWVVKKGQKSVYVVIEWPLTYSKEIVDSLFEKLGE